MLADLFWTANRIIERSLSPRDSLLHVLITELIHAGRSPYLSVYTNYVELELKRNISLMKHKVTVDPKVTGRKLSRVIELLSQKELQDRPHFTDYKSTIILDKKWDKETFNIVYFPEEQTGPSPEAAAFHVHIEFTAELQMESFLRSLEPNNAPFPSKEDMIQALNTMLYHNSRANSSNMVIGKKTFPLQNSSAAEAKLIGGGLQAMRGFFASVRPATSRVLVNVNIAYGVFYKSGNLLELVQEFGIRNLHGLDRLLKGLRVRKMHLARTNEAAPVRTIWGLATTDDGQSSLNPPRVKRFGANSKEVTFYLSNPSPGRYITVLEYFTSVLRLNLKQPDQPLVNVGSKDRPIYVPMELCDVVQDQICPTKRVPLTGEQTSKMLRMAVKSPPRNFSLISNVGVEVVGLKKLADSMTIAHVPEPKSLLVVPARQLDAPQVKYSRPIKLGDKAEWNLQGHTFKRPCKSGEIWSWAWVSFSYSHTPSQILTNLMNKFVAGVKTSLAACGIGVGQPHACSLEVKFDNETDDRITKCLDAIPADVQFVWIIIPDRAKILYDRIKYYSDISRGIITVVSVDKKITNANPQYFGNEALKINLKLGGINQVVHDEDLHFIAQGKTMIMGLDVIHPSTDLDRVAAPSVAGLVSSIDKHLAQWPAVLSVQTGRQEMVADLKAMTMRALESWKRKNGVAYPENILVYRDGVSEGQHSLVLKNELPLLKDACAQLYDQQKQNHPRISIIIVAKRHHTRFAPTKENNSDRGNNCKPGLVVDRGITESGSWNLFLQAHKAVQGTARPGFYTVIHDEIFRSYTDHLRTQGRLNGASAADICQEITHSLCYSFGRATKAVGIVTPTYYADLVCDRAGRYLRAHETIHGNLPGKLQDLQSIEKLNDKVKDTMFYI